MKLKVRLGCVHSTDVELGQGRSRDLISWLFRDIIRLIRDGEKGGRGDGGGGKREITYLSLHSHHHHNDSFIKMCSDESHFNVSLIVRDKVTRQSPQTTTFLKSRKGELKRNRAEILLLTRLVRTRSRLYWERERERERESHCVGCHCFCAVWVLIAWLPLLLPPPPHITHPPSAAWTAWLTFSPPPQHTHTHTHTHRSASQSCVNCTTVLPVCVQRPAVLTFQRTAPSISENRCTNSAHETSSSTAAPGPMTGLSIWTALTAGHRPWTAKHSDNCCEIHSHAEMPDETDTEILVSF